MSSCAVLTVAWDARLTYCYQVRLESSDSSQPATRQRALGAGRSPLSSGKIIFSRIRFRFFSNSLPRTLRLVLKKVKYRRILLVFGGRISHGS